MKLKHLKVKQNYGLETVPIYFDKLMYGGGFASETASQQRKRPRFYTLMEQEIKHPILVWFNKCFGELEKEAYNLQNKWLLEKYNVEIYETIGINELMLLLITNCRAAGWPDHPYIPDPEYK